MSHFGLLYKFQECVLMDISWVGWSFCDSSSLVDFLASLLEMTRSQLRGISYTYRQVSPGRQDSAAVLCDTGNDVK